MTEVILKIWRGSPGHQYWEEFEVSANPGANVISALMEIQKNPINRKGERVEPVVWEQSCLEEVCGSCSMLINGFPRQACTALLEKYVEKKPLITLAPFTKFPLVRDLMVDRSVMFENLKKVQGWIETDDGEGFGPLVSQEKQQLMYSLSTCMSCGCCQEACPQISNRSTFIGPAAISQVRLFNAHPKGALQKKKRLHALMENEGIVSCGNAQNCVQVCPKNIPLTESIAAIGRDVTLQFVRETLHIDDRK